MDVPQSRFPHEYLRIIQEVANSHFIAFDLEFSGVAGRRAAGSSGKPTLQELYEETKNAAEKYQILQVGLTIVTEDTETGRYSVRPYNFNISPLSTLRERHFGRTWSCHSGAISFLMRNGFQFDLPLTQGVHYLSRKEEQQARQALIEDEQARSKIADMELKKEDEVLVNHIRNSVQKWQSEPKSQQESYINIPGEVDGMTETLTRYQVRLTHQIVRNEYPNLKTTGMGHFVQVTNPTQEQQASMKLLQEQVREKDISKAIGFRWLLEAIVGGDISAIPDEYLLSGLTALTTNGQSPGDAMESLQEKLKTRRRVLVGHNCFTDLLYLYNCFFGDLPATIEEFQDEMHLLFPAIVDTKHIASFGSKRWGFTSLEDVENDLKKERYPRIEMHADYDRYYHSESYHEAGYDSLLTARVALKLSAKMEREGTYLDRKDEILAASPAPTNFGLDDGEGYETATESLNDSEKDSGGLMTTVGNALFSPLTAVRMYFDKKDGVSPTWTVDSPTDSTRAVKGSPGLLTDGVKLQSGKWTDKQEMNKVKASLARTSINDVLETGKSGPRYDQEEDLMTFSSGSSDDGSLSPIFTKFDSMVQKGEVMPRWNNPNGFWQVFGNKLQVNGCKEGICKIT